jgi:recombination protein RecT
MTTALATADMLKSPAFKQKIQEILDKKAPQFVASALTLVSNDKNLAACDARTVYTSLLKAAALDLPIEPNLGFAYLIGYRVKGNMECSFQMGYKGLIQLAQRSGQFKTISVTEIYEGQIVSSDPLKGFVFDFEKEVEKEEKNIVGYAAYFSLINGFEKTLYMTKDELRKHGVKFSQTLKKGFGLWRDDFNSMARKTVLKLLLSKFAPLNTQMQEAVISDQGVIREDTIDYPDAIDLPSETEEEIRIKRFIETAKKKEELEGITDDVFALENEEISQMFAEKLNSFSEKQ